MTDEPRPTPEGPTRVDRFAMTLEQLDQLEARAALLLAAVVFRSPVGEAVAVAEALHRETGMPLAAAYDRVRRSIEGRSGPGPCPCCVGGDVGELLDLCGPCWSNFLNGLSERCVHEPHRRPPYAFFRYRRPAR